MTGIRRNTVKLSTSNHRIFRIDKFLIATKLEQETDLEQKTKKLVQKAEVKLLELRDHAYKTNQALVKLIKVWCDKIDSIWEQKNNSNDNSKSESELNKAQNELKTDVNDAAAIFFDKIRCFIDVFPAVSIHKLKNSKLVDHIELFLKLKTDIESIRTVKDFPALMDGLQKVTLKYVSDYDALQASEMSSQSVVKVH